MSNMENVMGKLHGKLLQAKQKLIYFSSNPQSILTFLLVAAFFAIILDWMLQYRTFDGNLFLSYRISGQSENDQPWLPPQFKYPSPPIFGTHHFGDWELMADYSKMHDPYGVKLLMPAITPPLGLGITRILTLGGIGFGYILYLLITLICLNRLISKFGAPILGIEKVVLMSLATILSLPTIFAFDRGAVHLGVFILMGIGLQSFNARNQLPAILAMTIAISFKPYLVFFLLLPLALKCYQVVLKVFLLVITTNILLLVTAYSPTPIQGLYNYVKSIIWYQHLVEDNILRSVSGLSFISKLVEVTHGRTNALMFYSHNLRYYGLFTIIILIIGFWVAKQIHSPLELRIVLLLALSSLLVSDSYSYTLCWSSVGLIIWVKLLIKNNREGYELPHPMINLSLLALFMVVMSPCVVVVAAQYPYGLYFLHEFFYVPFTFVTLFSFVWGYGNWKKTKNLVVELESFGLENKEIQN